MRVLLYSVVVAALAVVLHSTLEGQALDAAQVLTATREALGGEKKLSAVRSFTATGRTRQLRGNNLVPIVFEITCELPDRFVRTDEFPAQDADPTTQGFNGDDLIQLPPLPLPGRGGPPAALDGRAAGPAPPAAARGGPPPLTPAQQRVTAVKQEFVRLTLGIFATSFSTYPLTFKYAAVGEAPEGKADILDVAGPANFGAQFVVQRNTHLPVMLMWQLPPTTVVFRSPGQPAPNPVPPGALVVEAPAAPAATATQEERDQYAAAIAALRRQALAQARPIDYRVYYGDFRDVDGVKFPFRLRRAIAGETIEETTFDRVRINAKIDPRKFDVQKPRVQ
jgi:hypothetical protein